MNFPQRRGVHSPRNAPPTTAGPSQSRGHAGVAQDALFPPANAAGNHRPDKDWEGMSPQASPVENIATQGQPQDLQYFDMSLYDMTNDHPALHEHCDHAVINYPGVALDIPVQAMQAQAAPAAPPAPEINILDDPALHAVAGPVQGFHGEWPHQGPVPIGAANDVLRQLAFLYLREPNSQVAVIRMEPGHAHGVRVVIALDLVDL